MHSFNYVSLLKIIKIKKSKFDNPSQAKHDKMKWFKNILVLLFFFKSYQDIFLSVPFGSSKKHSIIFLFHFYAFP